MNPRDTLASELREAWNTTPLPHDAAWLAVAALVERKIAEAQRQAFRRGARYIETEHRASLDCHACVQCPDVASLYPLPSEDVTAPTKIERLKSDMIWDAKHTINQLVDAVNALTKEET